MPFTRNCSADAARLAERVSEAECRCFQKAGFAKERLFCTQGGRTFQCRLLCREETCDNEDAVREIHLNSCLTASTAAAP